jgi:tRNA-splicing endonuclease subunit Sen54
MPTLYELTALFDGQPEVPLPMPRQRRPFPPKPIPEAPPSAIPPSSGPQQFWRLFTPGYWRERTPLSNQVRKPNPFMALKAGKKITIIAVVDSGNISFFRFGQGAFSEWPMA